jgi:hypothetical protein
MMTARQVHWARCAGAAVTVASGADQALLAVLSAPGWPLVTVANGTLMARRSRARDAQRNTPADQGHEGGRDASTAQV